MRAPSTWRWPQPTQGLADHPDFVGEAHTSLDEYSGWSAANATGNVVIAQVGIEKRYGHVETEHLQTFQRRLPEQSRRDVTSTCSVNVAASLAVLVTKLPQMTARARNLLGLMTQTAISGNVWHFGLVRFHSRVPSPHRRSMALVVTDKLSTS